MGTRTLGITVASAAFAGLMAVASPAMAAVTFDAATGTGFVGKGDVQTVFNWTNKALQTNASTVDFRVDSTVETTWTCTKLQELGNGDINEVVIERTTTTTTQGLVTDIARENSKGKDGAVTGFFLMGYEGTPVIETDGKVVGSCPSVNSGFVYDGNAAATVTGGGLQVTHDGTNWYSIG